MSEIMNLFFAGIGGQGVLLASELVGLAAFEQGYGIKKSEVHGMSQRGGSVTSHLRLGDGDFGPLIPNGQADYLVALHPEEAARHEHQLREGGIRVVAKPEYMGLLDAPRSLNVFTVGMLSRHMDIEQEAFEKAIRSKMKPDIVDLNLRAFRLGRDLAVEEE